MNLLIQLLHLIKKMTKFLSTSNSSCICIIRKPKSIYISSEQYFLETALNKNKIKIENKVF